MSALQPRRVLFLLPNLRGGGAERVILTLLRHLDRQRFRVALAVVDTSGAVYSNDIPIDVEFIDLGSSRVRYAMPRIVRLIWSKRPDVIFSTLGHLNLALAIVRPLLPNSIRYVARETALVSEVIADGCRWPSLWAWAYRRFYSRLDLVVCQSRAMRSDLIERYGFPHDRAMVINNPVDTLAIRQLAGVRSVSDGPDNATSVRLLAAGRFTAQKGFDLLIEALALCKRPGLKLTILGDGPLRSQIERLARDRGVLERVVFAGYQDNPFRYFRESDVFVLSSRYEGFPNVVLEALACGLPVISTPASGVSEIIDGIEGCSLADDISAVSLAREIEGFRKGARIPADTVQPYEVNTIVRLYEAALA
jgi:glycosyltransferase involved in cell wall biosynthesis